METPIEAFQSVDERQREFVQRLTLARGRDAAAAALDQRDTELVLERAQLQADRRLRQEQRFGRARQRAELDDHAERTQLLEPAALVVEPRRSMVFVARIAARRWLSWRLSRLRSGFIHVDQKDA
jgi:hypothetical protein